MNIVIMAGGRGTRFWPQSRIRTPKQFLNIVGEGSMLRQTFERVLPLADPSSIWVVTNEEYGHEVVRQIPEIPSENVITEPFVRSTAPCIGLAALNIQHRSADPVMVVLPADHYIPDDGAFHNALTVGANVAVAEQALVTIGIQPTAPETGYGYIEVGDEVNPGIHRVDGFREKPDRATAETFLSGGRHLWNSGMFIWTVDTILDNMLRHCPDLHTGLTSLIPSLGAENQEREVLRVYENLPTISIDYAVMEQAEHVFVVRGEFGWSDVGSWSAVQQFWDTDEKGNAFRGRVIDVDSSGSIVDAGDDLIALIGVEDLIVINTGDAVLVCRKDRDQDIKQVIEALGNRNLKEYL
jgi:mannose-1-phosphate guanylyltransferase